ncbi:hypothetical protein PVK06_020161 [Gossypium arboreum]|uniref:Uncharacterized protein n=1 Tax=Gossypium arboreum TaxID=29729 RepID=A0ABR0PLN5_GOSAR|nr:hypothetical protein PVK06_020161 [Gossypium arboreum]
MQTYLWSRSFMCIKDQVIKRGYSAVITNVEVRGEDVPIFPSDICEFYNISFYEKDLIDNTDLEKFQNIDMEDVTKYLTQDTSRWNYMADAELPTNFNQAIMFFVVKIWMQFISTRIALALNVSNVNVF